MTEIDYDTPSERRGCAAGRSFSCFVRPSMRRLAATKPTAPQPGDPDNNPPVSYKIQEIDRTLNSYAEAVHQANGPIRARLNPLSGPDAWDYFHGQFNGRGWTHGCLCYGTDPRMINYIWNTMPNTWVGVSVDGPVVKP